MSDDGFDRWVAPASDASKPTIKVPPCLGCGRLPHPDELQCLRRAVQTLMAEADARIERSAEAAYTAYATAVFGVEPGPVPKRGKESGSPTQSRPVAWAQLTEYFRNKWRQIAKSALTAR